jgi:hypothetical protein
MTCAYVSQNVRALVAAALDDTPAPVRAIWRRVDCWSEHTIASALLALVVAGFAERIIERIEFGSVRSRNLYRRRKSTKQGERP